MNVSEPSRQTRPPRVAALAAVAVVGGVAVAVSPWFTWLAGTGTAPGDTSGVALAADRAQLGIHGNAFVLGFAAEGVYNSLFGPAVPLIVGVVLAVIGGAMVLRGKRRAAWIAPVGTAVALWSVGAAGLTGGSGLDPDADIGGAGIRVWALGSALAALALGVATATDPRQPGRSVLRRAFIDWAALPAVLLGGASAELLHAAEEWQPFAAGAVFVAAASTAAFPAAGTVAALVAVAPTVRPLPVTLANGAALVIGGLLFALWLQVALA
jgi:hypothetical protein